MQIPDVFKSLVSDGGCYGVGVGEGHMEVM